MDWGYANIMGKRPALEEAIDPSIAVDIQTLRALNDELEEMLATNGSGEAGADSLLVDSYTDATCTATDTIFAGDYLSQIHPFIIPSEYTRSTYTAALAAANACFPTQLKLENSGTLFEIPYFTTDSSIQLSTQLVLTNNLQFHNAPLANQIRPYLPSEYAGLHTVSEEENAETAALAEATNAMANKLQSFWRPYVTQPNIFQYEIDRFNDIFPAVPASMNQLTEYKLNHRKNVAPAYKDFTFPLLPNTRYTVSFSLYARKFFKINELQIEVEEIASTTAPVWQENRFYVGIKRDKDHQFNPVSISIPPRTFFTQTDDPLATVVTHTVRVKGYYHFSTGSGSDIPVVGGCLQVVQI